MLRRASVGVFALACGLGLNLAAAAAPAPPPSHSSQIDPTLLAGIAARSIGPAAMSGRVAALVGVESSPETLYVGAAAGGVWKSVNGGETWKPVFDTQPVASIGAIAIFQPSPDIVWAGTGEGNPRNSASVGNGIYRSLDGGQTWHHLGLDATERISRIALHPSDPDIAYVAALGREWGENSERGVYKTSDGGHTWKRVLFVDERSGAADLVMDPHNPNKLFAAIWDYRRWPWSFRSGGPGSGLYVTYDAGATWKRLTEDDGLPKGRLGRIGIGISRSNPSLVYAVVESEGKNAIVRSEDGGLHWRTMTTDPQVTERPFYYSSLHVDPELPDRVYDLTSRLRVSDDGGKTFTVIARQIHPDFHAMWIDPHHPTRIVAGNDGGVSVSRDRGENWQFFGNLPLGQYYHVTVDMDTPYHTYGGLQDNGSWRGPGAVWEMGGIRNGHWQVVGGGDGFGTLSDPQDSAAGYSMSQGGHLMRWNLRTGERKVVRPPELSLDPAQRLRFNWNAGVAQDPFDPATIYLGSQYVHRSTDRGESWTTISPDLTTNNKQWQKQPESGGLTLDVTAAENYTTILSIAPSPLARGTIWVGTDDGRVQVTRDGGQTWTSVEANLSGVPANTWIPQIRPSRFNPAGAFVVCDDHRRSNWTPYVLRTDDYGKTWKSLVAPGLRGYALAIEQDPVDQDLLFLGTEFGLYVSVDAGAHWLPWQHGLPTVSVMDLIVHPRDHDLVLATHGRSLYVIDDVTPLRELSAAALAQPIHLFAGAPTLQHRLQQGAGSDEPGNAEFRGENRPYGAILTYSLNLPGLPLADEEKERERKEKERAAPAARRTGSPSETTTTGATGEEGPAGGRVADRPPSEASASAMEEEEPAAGGEQAGRGEGAAARGPRVEIRIADPAGKTIRTFRGPAHLGVNRAVWNLGRDALREPPRGERGGGPREDSGPQVPPGTYGVRIKYGDHEARGTVRVLPDPASKNTEADWQAREAAVRRAAALQEALVDGIERLASVRSDVNTILDRIRRHEVRAQRADQDNARAQRADQDNARAQRADQDSARAQRADQDSARAQRADQDSARAQRADQDSARAQRADQDSARAQRADQDNARAQRADPKAHAEASDREPGAARSAGSSARQRPGAALARSGHQLLDKLSQVERRFFIPPGGKGIVDDRTALSHVGQALQALNSSWAPPNPTQSTYLHQAEEATSAALAELSRFFAEDVPAWKRQVEESKLDLLPFSAAKPVTMPN